jgi:plastocyanin
MVVAALAAAALSACGSSSKSDDGASSTAATVAGGASVEYSNFTADPKEITVKVGQPVTWTNKDGAPHNVVSDSAPNGEKIHSPNMANGATFIYVCSIHPQMTGYKVIVTK